MNKCICIHFLFFLRAVSSLCSPGWSWNHSNFLTSASQCLDYSHESPCTAYINTLKLTLNVMSFILISWRKRETYLYTCIYVCIYIHEYLYVHGSKGYAAKFSMEMEILLISGYIISIKYRKLIWIWTGILEKILKVLLWCWFSTEIIFDWCNKNVNSQENDILIVEAEN